MDKLNRDQLHHLICKNLKALRLKQGKSQIVFGDYVEIANQQYSRFETGKGLIPASYLYLIAEGCGVDISYFYKNHDEN